MSARATSKIRIAKLDELKVLVKNKGDKYQTIAQKANVGKNFPTQALRGDPCERESLKRFLSHLDITDFDTWIVEETESSDPNWHIARPPQYFTGQEAYLNQVRDALTTTGQGKISQSAAVFGYGGIGKTALALAYAAQWRDHYVHGYFITANSINNFLFEMAQLSGSPIPENAPREDLERLTHVAVEKVRVTGPNLIIFDNADDLLGVDPFFMNVAERLSGQHVLFTSRPDRAVDYCITIQLEKMEPEVGGLCFYRIWKRDAEAKWTAIPPDIQSICRAMSEELDGMPLAVEQAGLMAQRVPPHSLLQEYRSIKSRLRETIFKTLPTGHNKLSLWATIESAMSRMSAEAKQLVILCSFLDPDHIDERLFTKWEMNLTDPLTAAKDRWYEITEGATNSGLLRTVQEPDPYVVSQANRIRLTLHRAVQSVVREMLGENQANWWDFVGKNASFAFLTAGRYREGVIHAQQSTIWLEQTWGSTDERLAIHLNNLASLLGDTNQLAEAEPLMRRALQIDQQSFGEHHPNVAILLNNLALLFQATNRLAEAEPLMRRALQIDETSFGEHHPKVAIRLSNLATLLQATNRLAEAEPLMRRALQIDQQCLGEHHPNVTIRMNNLAQLLQDTDRLAEAEPLMRRTLEIDEKSFGEHHPKVAIRLSNLASLLQVTNRLAEAEPLMRRALEIDQQSFGEDHPEVATDLNNLAQLLKATNRLTEAEPLARRGLLILTRFKFATGHPHPNYESGINNYAIMLRELGRTEEEIKAELEAIVREAHASIQNDP